MKVYVIEVYVIKDYTWAPEDISVAHVASSILLARAWIEAQPRNRYGYVAEYGIRECEVDGEVGDST